MSPSTTHARKPGHERESARRAERYGNDRQTEDASDHQALALSRINRPRETVRHCKAATAVECSIIVSSCGGERQNDRWNCSQRNRRYSADVVRDGNRRRDIVQSTDESWARKMEIMSFSA